jgi:hypothetical protein
MSRIKATRPSPSSLVALAALARASSAVASVPEPDGNELRVHA